MQHHVPRIADVGRARRHGVPAQPQDRFVAVGQPVAGRGGQGEGTFGFGDAHRHPVPDVQQGARIVVADRRDPVDSRHPQQQCQRQGGLVERGEHHRLVRADRAQPRGQAPHGLRVDRPRRGVDPRQRMLDDLVDAGQQVGGGPTARPAQQHHPLRSGRDGADRRAGDQHVTGRIRADHERRPYRFGGRGRGLHGLLAAQDLRHRRRQIGGHPPGGGDLLRPGHRGGHQHPRGPGGHGGADVPADVADEYAAGRCRAQLSGGGVHQARRRFAAVTAVGVVVRADQPRVEPAQQLLDAGVHGPHLLTGEVTPGQARLVRDDRQPQPGRAQPVQRRPRARHRPHLLRVAVVRHVLDQGAVAVQQHRVVEHRSGACDRPGGAVSSGVHLG
ncbi:hypothetical protein PSN01_04131 [Micromonospora saelicesensis]|nr:hypothetical protein PSN01_04131 [Micromonospora saelicesensis]